MKTIFKNGNVEVKKMLYEMWKVYLKGNRKLGTAKEMAQNKISKGKRSMEQNLEKTVKSFQESFSSGVTESHRKQLLQQWIVTTLVWSVFYQGSWPGPRCPGFLLGDLSHRHPLPTMDPKSRKKADTYHKALICIKYRHSQPLLPVTEWWNLPEN